MRGLLLVGLGVVLCSSPSLAQTAEGTDEKIETAAPLAGRAARRGCEIVDYGKVRGAALLEDSNLGAWAEVTFSGSQYKSMEARRVAVPQKYGGRDYLGFAFFGCTLSPGQEGPTVQVTEFQALKLEVYGDSEGMVGCKGVVILGKTKFVRYPIASPNC